MADQGTYVYAVASSLEFSALDEVAGVGDEPVRLIEFDDLKAIASTFDMDEFGEEGIHQQPEESLMVGADGEGSHTVIESARASGPVTPLRPATVYYSDQGVRSMLREQYDVFVRTLDRISGRLEWGSRHARLSEQSDTGSESTDRPGGGDQGTAGAGAGIAYLRRHRDQRQDREQASREAFDQADQIHVELRDFAADSRLHRPQNTSLSGHTGVMVLNNSYLVDKGSDEQFVVVRRGIGGVSRSRSPDLGRRTPSPRSNPTMRRRAGGNPPSEERLKGER